MWSSRWQGEKAHGDRQRENWIPSDERERIADYPAQPEFTGCTWAFQAIGLISAAYEKISASSSMLAPSFAWRSST